MRKTMYYHNELSRNIESDLIFSARKQLIIAWIVFLIVTIIMNVFFIAEWWSIAIRTTLILYPIYQSVKYYRINKREKKMKEEIIRNTSSTYNSSRFNESELLISARKQLIFAWFVFILATIILNIFFIAEVWSIVTRSILILFPIFKSIKYTKINKEEKKLKEQEANRNNYIKDAKSAYYWR